MNQDATLKIFVKDIVTDDAITDFNYIVNENNVGDPQVGVPEEERDPELFPSLKPDESHSPVVTSGESQISSPLELNLPPGRYIVSIQAPDYKLGGNWAEIIQDEITEITVRLYPHPLPLSRIRVHVFNDDNPVNGEDDVPLEYGIEGFSIIITDAVGEVTVDYFGNPLGTEYERDQDGNIILDQHGEPAPIPGTGGRILIDKNGDALIDNLPPGKYGVQAIPPDGTGWIQTTTIEGTHVIDAWIEEGNDGYSPREGFQMPLVWIGFVQPMEFPAPIPWQTGKITGTVKTVIEFVPPFRPLTLGEPVDRPWVALSDIGANDQQVYTGRGDRNGNFLIENVPPGTYQLAIWDEPLDYIISFRTVQIGPGEIVEMGDIGIPRWYGYIRGSVFVDTDEDGVKNNAEIGIPNVEVATRFKDGSMQYSTVSDMRGNYVLKEIFELERFAVAEVGFTRFGRTGATGTPDYGIPVPSITGCKDEQGNNVRCPETFPEALTLAELTWAAKTNRIDWGKRPYNRDENGGISGVVYYATMRNETDGRLAIAEGYEPGIPNITLNLYSTREEEGRIVVDQLINTTVSDAWEHPTGCIDHNDQPVECIEVPNISNQIRPGVFDGGYAFETYYDPFFGAEGAVEKSLPPGTYIVEIEVPEGYQAIDETGSTNTEEGDEFIPGKQRMQLLPPPFYESPDTPGEVDITRKVVELSEQMNATADFFLYTEVPVPGRIVGFLLDDVNIETDPDFIYYGEKRGIPNTPVGIRDYQGRLITTVHSDKNGIFEVLLPSSYTRNIPTPSGVAPGMYRVIGNDPGDPDNPNENYNPNYQTLNMVFDVWPGKTTYADVALFPITAFVETPGAQFSQPPACEPGPEIPRVFRVSKIQVNVDALADQSRTFNIFGARFGINPGKVLLNEEQIEIVDWNNNRLIVRVPRNFSVVGPAQLTVERSSGKKSISGVTIHLRKRNEYWPDIVRVRSDGTGDYPTIQDAIDNAEDGTLIVLLPGIYHESPIIYKNIKIQGVGPGGIRPNGNTVAGSVIDGRFFLSYQEQWLNKLAEINFSGAENVPAGEVKEISKGQVITVVAEEGKFSQNFRPHLDGCKITGARGEDGGGIYINAHASHLILSNNTIQSNGGGFGGGITIGQAYLGDNYNYNLWIHHNRVLNNGGISLGGAITIFNGAHNYTIEYNQICGNYSAEYGGGISHYGYSPGGSISHNIIEFNNSFDEGAGIFIGGEQPVPPATLSAGSGHVNINSNLIHGNLANDDGGGIRLLQPGQYRINIFNNLIVNNVSTDIGAGIALDDASDVVIKNNTIAKNITTATAEDSDGLAHGSGLVSELHSATFRASLPPGEPDFSNPVLFNNIFWDNRAGIFQQSLNDGRGGIYGIGNYGEESNIIDLEVFAGGSRKFNPQYCSLSEDYQGGSQNIIGQDPLFIDEYNLELTAVAFNMEPDFKSIKIVTVTPGFTADYHHNSDSPVIDKGINLIMKDDESIEAPAADFDGISRPQGSRYDIGAYEYLN